MTQRTILCFGDSNTHGTPPATAMGETRRYPPEHRWPHVMRALLPDGWTIIEEGHPGRTMVLDDPVEGAHKNGLRALPALLETHRPIELVIIFLGTNDQKARFGLGPFDIAHGLEPLFNEIELRRPRPGHGALDVMIIAPPPLRSVGPYADMFVGAEAKSPALAEEMKRVADERGAAFLDAGAHIEVSGTDGVHYAPEAQVALGNAIADAVKDRVPE